MIRLGPIKFPGTILLPKLNVQRSSRENYKSNVGVDSLVLLAPKVSFESFCLVQKQLGHYIFGLSKKIFYGNEKGCRSRE